MRIAIVGSRSFNNYSYLCKTINDFISGFLEDQASYEFVSGGATGADALGECFARSYGFPITIFYPDWKSFGKQAGYLRNKQIVENSDVIFAFWDGQSRGTKHTIDIAKSSKKPVYILTSWSKEF